MKTPSFAVNRDDFELSVDIARRAVSELDWGRQRNMLIQIEMDIIATHANGCPLRLRELLAADAVDFAHDVCGIRRNLDRATGKLMNCFVPRFAAPAQREALAE